MNKYVTNPSIVVSWAPLQNFSGVINFCKYRFIGYFNIIITISGKDYTCLLTTPS